MGARKTSDAGRYVHTYVDTYTMPGDRLRAVVELQRALDGMVDQEVADARAQGATWNEIATVFGISRAGATKRWQAVAPARERIA